MAKGVKTFDARLCAPAYMRLRRKRNAKIPTNEENYPCFAPQLAPTPKERKSNGCLTTCFWELRRDAKKTKSQKDPSDNLSVPRRNFVTAPTRFCECPGENLWMPWRIFRRRPTKFCECPDEIPNEILEAARRNLTTPPTICPTKLNNEILGWLYEIKNEISGWFYEIRRRIFCIVLLLNGLRY